MTVYIEFEKTNEIWSWAFDENDQYAFKKNIINRAVAGDTDSIMLSLEGVFDKDAPVDEVVEVADELASITNDSFPDFIEHAFNCPKERNQSIQTDREIIADKSLYLSKKRYIMHVVNDEGEPCDKLKTMGVEIKKTDTAEGVKILLTDIVDMILDDMPPDDILANVEDMRARYETFSLRDIAKPTGCKILRKYEAIYEEQGSLKGFPYNARAAMYYNSLCGKADRAILPSDKIGILYIKSTETPYIAFPLDCEELPAFMDDIMIDYDTQWMKARKKIVNYLESVGLDFKSRNDKVKKELFGFERRKKKKKKKKK